MHYLTIVDAAKQVLNRDICGKTALRWCIKGVEDNKGGKAKLKYKRICGQLNTTIEWFHEWIDAQNVKPEPPAPKAQCRSAKTAMARLEAACKSISSKPRRTRERRS